MAFGNKEFENFRRKYNAPNSPDLDVKSLEEQESERFGQDTGHRRTLIIWMIVIISAWLGLVILAVFLNGPLRLGISDTVLVTLLATTTANVLGLPSIILRDLFRGRGSGKRR